MRKLLPLLCLLALPAMAQDIETVRVDAASLAGLWKISWTMALAPKRGETPYEVTAWCRIEQARETPALHCFNRVSGTLTMDDGKLRIAWSPALMQSEVIEARMTSADSFAGSHQLRMAGITMVRSEGLTGTRGQPDPQAPDAGNDAPLLGVVLRESARGALSRPYEKTAQVELPETGMLQRLGPVQSVSYIAQAKRGAAEEKADFFSLYLVDFQNGNRLCGLHQRDDGVLDAFRCV